jgi:hypothetical protein
MLPFAVKGFKVEETRNPLLDELACMAWLAMQLQRMPIISF